MAVGSCNMLNRRDFLFNGLKCAHTHTHKTRAKLEFRLNSGLQSLWTPSLLASYWLRGHEKSLSQHVVRHIQKRTNSSKPVVSEIVGTRTKKKRNKYRVVYTFVNEIYPFRKFLNLPLSHSSTTEKKHYVRK